MCVTSDDDGHTVTVAVGWTVGVDLRTPNSLWSVPSQSHARVLRQIGALRRSGGAVQVAYKAVAPGRTELRALERPACRPGQMCPQFILLWRLYVRVTGR